MKILPFAVVIAALAGAVGSAHAAQHQCVSLSLIDGTQTIDERTVLIKLRGREKFMRMDLASRCPGLRFTATCTRPIRTNSARRIRSRCSSR